MHGHTVIPPDEARRVLRRQPLPTQHVWRWRHVALFIVVATAAIGLLWFTPASGQAPSAGGYQFLVVVTGSMSPAVNTGDMVAVRSVRPEAIAAGDIITFRDAAQPHLLITHRVLSVAAGETGPVFLTKGDNNPVPDLLPVAASQVVGRVSFRLPYAGYALNFLRTPLGIVSFIVLPGGLLILNGLQLIRLHMREADMTSSTNPR